MKSFCYIFFVVVSLCNPLEIQGTGTCENFYKTGDPSITGYDTANPAPLNCQSFTGAPDLHAVVYGCNSVNQHVMPSAYPPQTIASQSFTRKCTASIAEYTNFTCYDMDSNTNFTQFRADVAASSISKCQSGDKFQNPMYLYIITTAKYKNGVGSQNSTGKYYKQSLFFSCGWSFV